MNSMFIANMQLKENEGIYKKIVAEAQGLTNACGGNGYLLLKNDDGSRIINIRNSRNRYLDIDVISAAKYLAKQLDISALYIRHMIPSPNLVGLLRECKKSMIKIFYEIPTYPYYGEQFKASQKKYRAIGKLIIDTIFWPFIYKYIDHLVVIKSNTKTHMYEKMICITNGCSFKNLKQKTYGKENNKFSMVTVGTLYPYHGYDRVLQGLKRCNEKVDGKIVEFHVIGSSKTIDDLRGMTKSLGLKHVFFEGVKNVNELNEMFDEYDIGLGCMALHRRNADIDTTIKIIEYYCRGIPAATSGISPMDQYNKNFTIHVPDNNGPIDIEEVYREYNKITREEKTMIASTARKYFDWDYIMSGLLCGKKN